MKFVKYLKPKTTFLQTVMFLLFQVPTVALSQITDDFNDGDFSNNPTWLGTVADYQVNTSQQLQLNAAVAGTSYLYLPHNLTDFNGKEWRFWVRQNFAGSANNYGRIYLIASATDLSTDPDGVYLQMGEAGSTDAVRLMQRNGGVTTTICASADGSIANAFAIGVKIIRDNTGNWSLNIDFAGGVNYSAIATGVETTVPTGAYFGYLNVYTSGNITKFYLDDVYAGDQVFDTTPPVMTSVQVISNNQLDVLFSEAVTATSAQTINNYDLIPINSVSSATLDGTNPALVHLQLITPLVNGNTYTLSSNAIEDLSGNIASNQSLNFTYLVAETPLAGDVLINEFMADPSPVVGLPEVEFVEIYNKSNKVFNVSGWKLGDNATFGTITSGWLLPNQYLVLCPNANVAEFTNAVGVTSFPSLNNAADDIVIQDNTGVQLDKISYTDAWYQNTAKKDGGWTIERINPNEPCSQASNWKASTAVAGGTPGAQNSVHDVTPDSQAAQIAGINILSTNQIEVVFNKMVDSTSLKNAAITVNPTLTENNRTIASIHVASFSMDFVENFAEGQFYTLSIPSVVDCWGNTGDVSATFVLPSQPDSGDVVINEILVNPITGGSDFVELYNKSDKLLDIKNWKIARIYNGVVTDYKTITNSRLLHPKDYLVVTADSNFVMSNYPATIPNKFYALTLPTLSNDTGSVVLTYDKFVFMDTIAVVLDQLVYSSKWHFKLIDDNKGKTLERLDPNRPTQDASNWHTAAESIGFGTPGGKNSQYYPAIHDGEVSLSSETISPDNDGFEDVLLINYTMTSPGMVASFYVYDGAGRKVRTIAQNELLGMEGTIVWDGVRDDGQKALIGTYVLVVNAFATEGGKKFVAKKPFVVAGKL